MIELDTIMLESKRLKDLIMERSIGKQKKMKEQEEQKSKESEESMYHMN